MKLSVKDLINVGLFSVIYFIMFTISGILGYIPICVVILPLIAGILGGIPFVLFTIKEQKFGAEGRDRWTFHLPCRADLAVCCLWSGVWAACGSHYEIRPV